MLNVRDSIGIKITENSERIIEHNRLFKELILAFFGELLELFFPDLIPHYELIQFMDTFPTFLVS